MRSIREWMISGSPWVWLAAGAVSVSLVMVLGLLLLIAVRGLGQFWPAAVTEFEFTEPEGGARRIIGELTGHEKVQTVRLREQGFSIPDEQVLSGRYLVKTGNRDLFGFDFRWIPQPAMGQLRYPQDIVVIEREEWGDFYGYLQAVKEGGKEVIGERSLWKELQERIDRARELREEIRQVEKNRIGAVNYKLERLRLRERGLALAGVTDDAEYQAIADERDGLQAQYEKLNAELASLYETINRDSLTARISDGRIVELPLAKVIRAYRPNHMDVAAKLLFYIEKLGEFIFDEPREANTEGGVFPAIFGTVLMVMIMAVFVTPFGVVAAVYLREYARQGPLTRTIRIAVNNLAGVPSVVYGVFGLGFFVYFVGGQIDNLFYPEGLPAPTFGTPGLIWSSLTLAILTVPVVIVATEEGLARIPRAIREGSLALGATKAETLWRTVLPMATPAMMTGLVLAVARAAGEVAPLMMVGVVKLAPSLALDGNFPFLHLERKFMHLGFHIYDVGFQSPNVEAARPLVYATALLLVFIIVALNLAAIRIRSRLRERYSAAE